MSLPRPKQSVIADTVVLRVADSVLPARGSQTSKLQKTRVAGLGNPGFRGLQGFRRFNAFQGKPLLGETVLQTNAYTLRLEDPAHPPPDEFSNWIALLNLSWQLRRHCLLRQAPPKALLQSMLLLHLSLEALLQSVLLLHLSLELLQSVRQSMTLFYH